MKDYEYQLQAIANNNLSTDTIPFEKI